MPALRIRSDSDAEMALKLARRAALDQGLSLSDEKNGQFTASKGNLLLSMLAGGLLSHARFQVKVEKGHGGSEIIIEGKSTAVTGLAGQGSEVKAVNAFGDAIAACIESEGGKVLARNEI